MDSWKHAFLEKLHDAQRQCAKQFESALERAILPLHEQLSAFLRDNGFEVSTPLNEPGRRSFKYELAENAYLLMIFQFAGVGEFQLRSETFVPGTEPIFEKSVGQVADIDQDWTERRFEEGLDRFVDLLAKKTTPQLDEKLAVV